MQSRLQKGIPDVLGPGLHVFHEPFFTTEEVVASFEQVVLLFSPQTTSPKRLHARNMFYNRQLLTDTGLFLGTNTDICECATMT